MAKNRFAIKALNKNDEQILVTLELNVSNMNVEIKSFPIATMPESDSDEFMKKFMSSEDVDFPEKTEIENRSFTEESLLPDHIRIDGKSGAIRQLQNEWSYLLLNAKLFEQFNVELDNIKQKASELKNFSHELFDETKEFWEKVLEYKKEREISQEKLSYFKEEINGVFDHLKNLKETMLKEKDELSEKVKSEVMEAIQSIEAKMEEQGVHFKTIMDELKEVQSKLRKEEIKRDVKNILFDTIQATFDKVKTKRDEVLGQGGSRADGLIKVLDRVVKSLEMDKKDLEYNSKKLNQVNNKLELQLREAKINVLKDRIASKEEKVADLEKSIKRITSKKPAVQGRGDEEKNGEDISKEDMPIQNSAVEQVENSLDSIDVNNENQ